MAQDMSTRAILGIKKADGSILGAWQWNDGAGLTGLLNKKFNSLDKAMSLISEGMWSTMFTRNEKDEFEDWLVNDLYKDSPDKVTPRKYIGLSDVYLLKYECHENRSPEIYTDFKEVSEQDINHIYLFNPKINKWVMNKDI